MYDIYSCNSDDSARFILGKSGKRTLIVVGLNPSTADKETSDTTVAKVEKVALDNGFDGFVMTNLYPQRSTDPTGLSENANRKLFHSNIRDILGHADTAQPPIVWAAWGGDIMLRPYLLGSLKILHTSLKQLDAKWIRFGELRQDGHPRHPSRLSYSWSFTDFDIESYLDNLS